MRISPADTATLTDLIHQLQTTQAAHEERSATNARLSGAVRDAKPDSPERAEAVKAWETARKDRPASERSVLEARDALANFAVRVELLPDEQPQEPKA